MSVQNPPPQWIVIAGGRRYENPAWTAYNETVLNPQIGAKKAAAAKAIADSGITIRPVHLDSTTASVVDGVTSRKALLNPEQKETLAVYDLNRQVRAGDITVAQYQQRLAQINQNYANETQARSFMFAERAAPGLRAAAKAEAQRFADLGAVDYIGQQQKHTSQLEKVAADVASAGFDVAKLQQAKGKPNVNASLKINTPSEIKQNQFAKSQAFRTVQSVTPGYGMDIVDSSGARIATNVKQSGGFGFAEKGKTPLLTQAIISSSGNVLGTLTGKSPGSIFTIFETKKQTKSLEVQGPQKEIFLPSYVKNAFYTFEDTIGPKDPRFTGLVGKDFIVKDEFVNRVDYLGVPPKSSTIGKELNKFTERAEALAFDKTKDPLSQLIIGGGKFVVSIGTSVFNLSGMAHQGLEKLIYGKDITPEQVKIPRTLAGDYLGAQIEGIGKAVTSGDTSELVKANIEAEKRAGELYQKQGPIVSLGEILSETVGVPFKAISPIKAAFAKIPTETGPKVIGGTLKVGFGKLSVPIVTRLEGKFALGSGKGLLTKTTFKELSPASIDVTTGRALKAFELATVKGDIQNILTSKQGLKSLVGAGKILPTDIAYLKAEKQLAEFASLAQKKLGQKELLQVDELPRGIFEGLETVKEEDVFVKIIPDLRPVKGSQTFFTQLSKKYQPTGLTQSDTDIDYLGGLLGERYAANQALKMSRQTVQELNDIMLQQRGATASGSKVFTGIVEGITFNPPKKLKPTQYYHGSTLDNLEGLQKEGYRLEKAGETMAKAFKTSKIKAANLSGIEGLYLTKNPQYAQSYTLRAIGPNPEKAQFAKGGLGIIDIGSSKILSFDDIESSVIRNLQRQFKPELSKEGFGKYQAGLIEYAKGKGYEGIIKPVKSSPVGRIELALFEPSKARVSKILKPSFALKGRGEKLAELLTRSDVEEGINSILSDQSKIFGIGKTRKIVRTPTGYRGFLGRKKTRKEVPLPTQLLNQISSATRIQKKGIEDVFKGGGPIPFLKPEYDDFLRTESGFRVGTDAHRVKDLVRQQPIALQIAELLDKKIPIRGFGQTKTQEIKGLFETIKKSKPEIDFDAAFKEVEKIGESENIESIASYYSRQSKSGAKQFVPFAKSFRPSQERDDSIIKTPKMKSVLTPIKIDSITSTKQTKSISTSLNIKLDNLIDSSLRGSSRVKSSPSILESLAGARSSGGSVSSRVSKASKPSPVSKSLISFSGIFGKSSPSISSPIKVSVPSTPSSGSPGSPGSPGSLGSPTFRSPPFKSPPKSPTIRMPIVRQPPSPPPIRFPKIGFLFAKFDQLKTQRLPSYAKRRFFVADIADPMRAGVFAPKGVKKLISSNPDVFKQIDINLAKARRNKKAYDPLNYFKIAKSGKYVYSEKNLLGKISKFKI